MLMPQHPYQRTVATEAATVIMRWLGVGILLATMLFGSAGHGADAPDAAAQANNPLANMTALNFQD